MFLPFYFLSFCRGGVEGEQVLLFYHLLSEDFLKTSIMLSISLFNSLILCTLEHTESSSKVQWFMAGPSVKNSSYFILPPLVILSNHLLHV